MIQRRASIDGDDFAEAAKAAYQFFDDAGIVEYYFRETEGHMFEDDNERLKHLQLKYFHSKDQWIYLNEMADIFFRQQRYYLVHMCLAESLRQQPDQDGVYLRMQKVKEKIHLPRLKACYEDTCTVSVIMTTYQFRPEIRESIDSVLQQTFTDYELVIVNDAGPKDVESVIGSFGSDKIRYIRLKNNLGLAGARNEGLKIARGHYIAYLDDDDIYYSNHLQVLVEAAQNTGCKVAYSTTQAIEGFVVDGVFQHIRPMFVWDESFDKNTLISRIYITTCSIMHKRSLLSKVGMFQPDMRSTQDWDLWLKFALKTEFRHVSEITSEYRISKDNRTMANKLGAHFYGELVCRYHGFRCGEIAQTKALIAQGKRAEARRQYENIKNTFEDGFQAPFVLGEIAALAEQYGDNGFACLLTQDYFRKDARACLKSALHRRSAIELGAVLPLLPAKIMRGIGLRCRAIFK